MVFKKGDENKIELNCITSETVTEIRTKATKELDVLEFINLLDRFKDDYTAASSAGGENEVGNANERNA